MVQEAFARKTKQVQDVTDSTVLSSMLSSDRNAASIDSPFQQGYGILRSVFMLGLAGITATVAFCAFSLLFYVVITHAFTPRQLSYAVPLPLRVNESRLDAEAVLKPATEPAPRYRYDRNSSRAQAAERLATMQRFGIDLELQVPKFTYYAPDGSKAYFVHISAQLSSEDGRILGHSSQGVLLYGGSRTWVQSVLNPWEWIHLFSDRYSQTIRLFSDREEFVNLNSALLCISINSVGDKVPPVLQAKATVQLRIHFLRHVLYLVRPRFLAALLLGCGAFFVGTLGTICSSVLIILLLKNFLSSRRVAPERIESDAGSIGSDGLSELLDSISATPRDNGD